jgi:antitoxin CptB
MSMAYDGEVRSRTLERLRWKCRRGLLELDLVLRSFLADRAESLSDQQIKVLSQLLDYPDNDLWDAISGRVEVIDPIYESLLIELRAQSCCDAIKT